MKIYSEKQNESLPSLINPQSSALTIPEANKSIQLSKLKKDQGEAAMLGYIMMLIKEMLPFVKYDPQKFTPVLIGQYAKMIANNWWMFKAQELALCLMNGINGKYGKIYGNIAYTDIVRWLQLYSEEAEQYCDGSGGIDTEHEFITDDVMLNAYKELYQQGQQKLLAKTAVQLGYDNMDKLIPTLSRSELIQMQKDIEDNNMTSVYESQLALIKSCVEKSDSDEEH